MRDDAAAEEAQAQHEAEAGDAEQAQRADERTSVGPSQIAGLEAETQSSEDEQIERGEREERAQGDGKELRVAREIRTDVPARRGEARQDRDDDEEQLDAEREDGGQLRDEEETSQPYETGALSHGIDSAP